jgi:hypothetical protein
MRARPWVFVLIGAILIGFTSFLFATTRDPGGWNALVIRSLVVGGSVGAVLGLVVARRFSLVTFISVIVAVVLTAAATFVILDSRQRRKDLGDESWLATAVISQKDIPRNQALDPLIEDGVIIEIDVPRTALEVGAITDIRELRDSTAISDIGKHEQILASNVMQLDRAAT